jgi:hypothetical protein
MAKLSTIKFNMAKLTSEYIFYGKSNYAKLIMVKIKVVKIIMAK